MTFAKVAEAIAESGFVTSQLPIILSLEMHLCPKQQRQLAAKAVAHFESALLTVGSLPLPSHHVKPRFQTAAVSQYVRMIASDLHFDCCTSQYSELVSMSGGQKLSPNDLKGRVLMKGKVKLSKKKPRKNRDQTSIRRGGLVSVGKSSRPMGSVGSRSSTSSNRMSTLDSVNDASTGRIFRRSALSTEDSIGRGESMDDFSDSCTSESHDRCTSARADDSFSLSSDRLRSDEVADLNIAPELDEMVSMALRLFSL